MIILKKLLLSLLAAIAIAFLVMLSIWSLIANLEQPIDREQIKTERVKWEGEN